MNSINLRSVRTRGLGSSYNYYEICRMRRNYTAISIVEGKKFAQSTISISFSPSLTKFSGPTSDQIRYEIINRYAESKYDYDI
jgi:hypothetical protein